MKFLLRTERFFFLILLLFFLNLGGYENVIGLFLLPVIILYGRKCRVSTQIIMLLLFLCSYCFFMYYHSFQFPFYRAIYTILYPICFYVFGDYISRRCTSETSIYYILFSIIIAISIIPFVSTIVDVFSNGYMKDRNIALLFRHDQDNINFVSATLVGAYVFLNMTLLPFIFYPSKNFYEKKYTKIAILLFLIGVLVVTNVSCRTGVLIPIICLLIYVITGKGFFKKLFYIIITCALLFVILYATGLIGSINHSLLFERFSNDMITENDIGGVPLPRLFRWNACLKGMLVYPLGGEKQYIAGSYAHNLWLDTGWKVGIIPLIPLLIFTIIFIIQNIKLYNNHFVTNKMKMLLLSISLGLIFQFSVEPVMEGLFNLFCFWCFYCPLIENVDNSFSEKHILVRDNFNQKKRIATPKIYSK